MPATIGRAEQVQDLFSAALRPSVLIRVARPRPTPWPGSGDLLSLASLSGTPADSTARRVSHPRCVTNRLPSTCVRRPWPRIQRSWHPMRRARMGKHRPVNQHQSAGLLCLLRSLRRRPLTAYSRTRCIRRSIASGERNGGRHPRVLMGPAGCTENLRRCRYGSGRLPGGEMLRSNPRTTITDCHLDNRAPVIVFRVPRLDDSGMS